MCVNFLSKWLVGRDQVDLIVAGIFVHFFMMSDVILM